MLKRYTMVLALAAMSALACAAEDKNTSGTAVGNKTCPVMTDKAITDKAKTVTYKGQVVGLCCKRCVKTFNENPEEYLKKAQEFAKAGK